MGHTPYGYKIVNGMAVIDEIEGAAVRKLYEGYLSGLGLQAAADEAGIPVNHCQAKRMMLNKKYLIFPRLPGQIFLLFSISL